MTDLLIATSYFPPLSYMARCLQSDRIVIEAYETYPKQTRRNRCEIAGPNGRQKLVVPVRKPFGNHTLTKDICITYDLPWQNVHLKSITTAYNKSPFLLYYMDHFHSFFEKKYHFLIDLNGEILMKLLDLFGSVIPVEYSSEYQKTPAGANDLRDVLVSKNRPSVHTLQPYTQPFAERYGFLGDLSALDLIFCLGPGAKEYLNQMIP